MSDAGADKNRPQPQDGEGEQASAAGAQTPSSARIDTGGPVEKLDQPTVISKALPQPSTGSGGSGPRIDLGEVLLGQKLDHFELQSFVGGGGMGAVFRALDTRLNRTVALKVLSHEQSADEETVRRFRNEAQSAARCDHEKVARVFHVGEDQGLHYIAFEFIEGTNVRDLVQRVGPLPISEVVSYTLQVAEALSHASSRDVVHRDIKPSNIIVNETGAAKLVDMGLARMAPLRESRDDLTASGVTLGTFDYISPEQARDPRNVDIRSDIYSLGCTAYFMLAARPPFPEGTVLQKLLQHQGDDPPDPREFNPDLPDDLTRVVNKMMAKDPRRRYQTAEELIHDLWTLANQLGIALPGTVQWAWEHPPRPAPSRLERHLPWLVPVVSLLLVVAVLHFNSRATSEPGAESVAGLASGEIPGVDSGEAAIGPPPGGSANGPGVATDPPNESIRPIGADSNNGEASRSEPASASASTDDDSTSTENADDDAADTIATENGTVSAAGDDSGSSTADDSEIAPAESIDAPSAAQLTASGATGGLSADPNETQGGLSIDDEKSNSTTNDSQVDTRNDLQSDNQANVENAAAVPATATQSGILLVPRDGGEPIVQDSLQSACEQAGDGDVIELRFSGRREEQPLELRDVRISIRAAAGYNPSIVFRAGQLDPLDGRRAMISVIGGQLELIDVDLDFDVTRDATAESWTLFDVQRVDQLRLERCWLTIRNASDQLGAYHPQVAFFDLRAADAGESVFSGVSPFENQPRALRIELEQCVARGEATFIRYRTPQPLELTWDHGLLATTERLLDVESRTNELSGDAPHLEIDLRHVTLVARRGIARFENRQSAPYLPVTVARVRDSIIHAEQSAPLFEHAGISSVDDFRDLLSWQFDRVFARDGRPIFWRIRGQTEQGLPDVETLPSWRAFLRGVSADLPRFGVAAWGQLPASSTAVHEQSPADYQLVDSISDRPTAFFGASGGRHAGFDRQQLPDEPSDTEMTTR